jgi:hypothetical protein
VRFFGKVLGTKKDYYIVEAQMEDWPEEEEGEDDENENKEGWGTGLNAHVYYATNSAETEWTQLPLVRPEQVVKSREMRRFFTGDLKASVLGMPRFPWGEATYLRAQIARIAAATTVAPKGFYMVEEDDEEAEPEADEEFKPIPAKFLNELHMWYGLPFCTPLSHLHPSLALEFFPSNS